jgi:hypothetical protein
MLLIVPRRALQFNRRVVTGLDQALVEAGGAGALDVLGRADAGHGFRLGSPA